MADGILTHRIHKLPDSLINKIAAGEVIERPASVVKELLENSLDAGATRINIDIRNGGSRLIRVKDNGSGIHPDDLVIAVDRHTTSKLNSDVDLWQIKTLGFRGEALSSIASVSRFTLTSKQNAAEHGWSVTFAKGNASPAIQPAAHPPGTTVEVKDLFHNTPARRKFLRSERTEFIHIQELVKRAALCRFNLSIKFTHNDRQVFHVTDDEQHPARRVAAIMGRPFQTHALMVDQQVDNMRLYGWLGQPDAARSQTDLQYFYLNGRMVKDKLVNHAIRLAFQDRLYAGRHPVYLLYLEMDVAAVDVNVHPAKQEVRFRDSRTVHDFIFGTLHRSLNEQPQLIDQKFQPDENNHIRETRTGYQFAKSGSAISQHGQPVTLTSVSIGGRYIIAEEPGGAILVDVYRAREWITYIKLKQEWSAGHLRSRPVLVPLSCQVTVPEAELAEQLQEFMAKLGLVIQRSTPTELLIRELPLVLSGADAIALVKNVLSILKRKGDGDEQTNNLLKTLSTHANDSAQKQLTSAEMNLLLAELHKIKTQLTFDEYKTILCHLDLQSLHDLLND